MRTFTIYLLMLISSLSYAQSTNTKNQNMKLGAFSVSLNVKDLQKSRAFYEKLGFSAMGGNEKHNYLIMKNGTTIIGLFQGIIQENMLTFNPGWDENAKEFNPYDDVRDIQKTLKKEGVKLDREASESTKGKEYISLKDPDGNHILIDQHR